MTDTINPTVPPDRFATGDRVRHGLRPEWGVGRVESAQGVRHEGKPAQRLTIRFDRAGLKTLSTAFAPIEAWAAASAPSPDTPEDGGKGGSADTQPDRADPDAMVLAPTARAGADAPLAERLAAVCDGFRFEGSGEKAVLWAIARTGLADPLSRFARHEIEDYRDRFLVNCRRALAGMVPQVRAAARDPGRKTELEAVLRKAPEGARRAWSEVYARR